MARGVIQAALADDWPLLAPLVRRHFDLDDGKELWLEGTMDVTHVGFGRVLLPLLGAVGVLVPHTGRGIACTVRHRIGQGVLLWEREFHFPGRKPYRFVSRMRWSGRECLEQVRLGFVIRLDVSRDGGGIVFEDRGYAWQLGRLRLPLRLRWLLGAVRVEERQQGDLLAVCLTLRHPWLGLLFRYQGRFAVRDDSVRGLETTPT